MTKQTKKFLEFNGRTLLFLSIDGTFWVAIKPICEALGVQYERQYKNLNADPILGQLLSKQTMVAADNRVRQMVSLPEKWVYGWLFSINSSSPDLLAYKKECYHLLYQHFHGPLTERIQTLQQKSQAEEELDEAMATLLETPAYKSVLAARERVKASGRSLRALDADLKAGQLAIW